MKMLTTPNPYNTGTPELTLLQQASSEEITYQLSGYLSSFQNCFARSQQNRYFGAFVKGLLSNIDRKSIEPIALSFLGEKEVRGMQQFFTRSRGWEEAVREQYKVQISTQLSATDGFLSVDESDFVKKGKDSAGAAGQYCGRLGKKENCQAGVFISYASERGIGLVDSRLYLPESWFGDDYAEKRKECQIPDSVTFQTKNKMAKEMISTVINSGLLEIHCIGADASFGSDHTFLDSLPETVNYFVSVRENEYIFRNMPNVSTPENVSGRGRKFKHPRSEEHPVAIKSILDDDSIPWVKRIIGEGTKGPIVAEIKSLRCISCRKENRLFMPKSEVWVYIRKHEDGTIKYFVSNMPADTDISELDKLATARWSIEQCFQECKSYLGMSHYETRPYKAWHRHMLLVMVAHLFITLLRDYFKKIRGNNYANGKIHHGFADSNPNKPEHGVDDYSLSFAA
jgi:SRSO17 transposase